MPVRVGPQVQALPRGADGRPPLTGRGPSRSQQPQRHAPPSARVSGSVAGPARIGRPARGPARRAGRPRRPRRARAGRSTCNDVMRAGCRAARGRASAARTYRSPGLEMRGEVCDGCAAVEDLQDQAQHLLGPPSARSAVVAAHRTVTAAGPGGRTRWRVIRSRRPPDSGSWPQEAQGRAAPGTTRPGRGAERGMLRGPVAVVMPPQRCGDGRAWPFPTLTGRRRPRGVRSGTTDRPAPTWPAPLIRASR